MFTIEDKHVNQTICPLCRAEYGIRWRTCKVRCTVPIEIAAHRSITAKGERRLNSKESEFILKRTGKLYEIGLRKYLLTSISLAFQPLTDMQ